MVSNRTLPLHCGIVHRDHQKRLTAGTIEIVDSKTMKLMSSKIKQLPARSVPALPHEYSLVLAMGRFVVFLHVVPRISFYIPTPAWQERFESARLTVGFKTEDDMFCSSWSSDYSPNYSSWVEGYDKDDVLNRSTSSIS